MFKDPVLDSLQADMVVGNQNLAAALAQVTSARAVLSASRLHRSGDPACAKSQFQ